jgi:hypothetical protein
MEARVKTIYKGSTPDQIKKADGSVTDFVQVLVENVSTLRALDRMVNFSMDIPYYSNNIEYLEKLEGKECYLTGKLIKRLNNGGLRFVVYSVELVK